MSLLEDIRVYLESHNLGANVFEGRLPDDPNDIVALYGYAGRAPVYYLEDDGTKHVRERPGLQLQSRATRDADAESKAYALTAVIEMIVNEEINGTNYIRVEALSSPYQLRHDANDRSIWACNFLVEKEK